jgi:hypothetical protein
MADLPVITFIQERLAESEAAGGAPLETRKGSGFYDLFIKPQELMLQPLLSSMETTLIAQSVHRMRSLSDPDTFDESLVDDAVGNVYITRDEGAYARTTVRVFYASPVAREFPTFAAEFTSGSLSYFNESDILITAAQMSIQQIGTLYYMDVPVRAQSQGDEYNVGATDITQFVNDPEAISVSNLTDAVGGLAREKNTALLDRAKNSIGVRDLETVKGINAILRELFPFIREIQSIGMGDPEMMRDILYNTHTGGYTDVYIKTPKLQTLSKNIIGLTFDYTREAEKILHMEMTAISFTDPLADLSTPNIVSASVSVKEDTIETAAQIQSTSIPSPAGLNLSANEWIKLKLNNGSFINIKVSGATPSATQRFEVINAINSALGLSVAATNGTDRILVKSNLVGLGSSITFSEPDAPRTDATAILFPDAVLAGYAPPVDAVISGVVAQEYLENIDYQVDYAEGKIIKLPGSNILSGDYIAASPGIPEHPADSGAGTVLSGQNTFTVVTLGSFDDVRAGDTITIVASTGVATGDYVVQEKLSGQAIKISGLQSFATDVSVQYYIVSNQVVVVEFKYNPLSVDIGNKVLLDDGLTRGIRTGRENFTITDMTFLSIISIEEIDSATGEGLGIFLTPPGGFGHGGFGLGGFGNSSGGEYRFVVNDPTARFSAFEDSMILFDPTLFGKSYKITYASSPEVVTIHDVCRDDLERVTGADVLPKNFVPGFVDMNINIRRDLTNATAPDTNALATLMSDHVHTVTANTGLKASDLIKILEDSGIDSVQTPFTMTGKVLNTDGSSTFYSSEDVLQVPTETLPKVTDNFVTGKIVHWYPGTITVTEI